MFFPFKAMLNRLASLIKWYIVNYGIKGLNVEMQLLKEQICIKEQTTLIDAFMFI